MPVGEDFQKKESLWLYVLLQSMSEGLLVVDVSEKIKFANPTFCSLFGLTSNPAGHSLANVCRHPSLLSTVRDIIRDKGEKVNEIVLVESLQSRLLAQYTPIFMDGELVEILVILQNISDNKQFQRSRRDLVTNLSHELRTPLAIIRGYAETLANNVTDTETVIRFSTIIQNHTSRFTNLVNDMLTLSQLEADDFHLSLVSVNLPKIIIHCCDLYNTQASIKGLTIDIGAVPDVNVLVDPHWFEKLLGNLLENALKFTQEGGRVTIGATDDGEFIKVSVRDTGRGLPVEEQLSIFEPFYRPDAGRSREHGGAGLGLAIVQHLVQLHGGAVGVESVPGQGACFFFTLRRG